MTATRCAHVAVRPYFRAGETDFQRCAECGMVLRQPMPTAAELDAIYASLYGADSIASGRTHQESGSFALEQYARHLTRRLLRPGQAALDYGCGSGQLVQLLRTAGHPCEGVEASPGAREFCRRNRGIELRADLAEVTPASVDVITMIEVIEHLTDPHQVLVELRGRLRPGGRLFVTTPNRRSLRARLEGGRWREACKKFHVVLFDDASLRETLARAGFRAAARVMFPPIQRAGASRWLSMRGQQLLGLGGTLCFVATAPARELPRMQP